MMRSVGCFASPVQMLTRRTNLKGVRHEPHSTAPNALWCVAVSPPRTYLCESQEGPERAVDCHCTAFPFSKIHYPYGAQLYSVAHQNHTRLFCCAHQWWLHSGCYIVVVPQWLFQWSNTCTAPSMQYAATLRHERAPTRTTIAEIYFRHVIHTHQVAQS